MMLEILITAALRALLLSLIAALCLRAAIKHVVDWFCNGSLQDVLVGMVDAPMQDSCTLRRLARRTDEVRAKKGG
jgi:hypothetical protein